MDVSEQPGVRQLTAEQVKQLLDSGQPIRLIDVREPYEHAIAAIEGAELLPLSRAQEWIEGLPRDQDLVFFCHAGVRSMQVASYLVEQGGFTRVANMLGGIHAWSARVDPRVPQY